MISTTTLFLITAFFHILYSGYLTVSYDHLLSESVLLVLRSLIDIGMVMKKYALHKAIVCWREIHALPGNNATPTTIQGGNRYQKAQQKKKKKTLKMNIFTGKKSSLLPGKWWLLVTLKTFIIVLLLFLLTCKPPRISKAVYISFLVVRPTRKPRGCCENYWSVRWLVNLWRSTEKFSFGEMNLCWCSTAGGARKDTEERKNCLTSSLLEILRALWRHAH